MQITITLPSGTRTLEGTVTESPHSGWLLIKPADGSPKFTEHWMDVSDKQGLLMTHTSFGKAG